MELTFSYNEDRGGKYDPFWCVHIYLITSVGNKDRARRELKKIYKRDNRIPRPVKVVDFNNSAWRRSYAYKTRFIRRIGYAATMIKNGVCRKKMFKTLRETSFALKGGWNYLSHLIKLDWLIGLYFAALSQWSADAE